MNILVCVKQIVEPDKIEYDSKTNTIIRNSAYLVNNPSDLNALEFALKIKDQLEDVKITTLSMGALICKDKIKELIELGADKCYLLSDKRLAGSDASATSYALACAIKEIGEFDLILCGEYSLDGETSIVPPQIAEYLQINHICSVVDISVCEDAIKIKKKIEQGYAIFKTPTPVLLSIVKDSNTVRFPKLSYMLKASDYIPQVITLDDIKSIDVEKVGLNGSKTIVDGFEEISTVQVCDIFEGDDENGFECIVDAVINNLQ